MINAGDTVYAAVSGGADSCALLLFLKQLSGELAFTLRCIHINHCLRGAESDRDEYFVRSLCGRLGVECEVRSADVAAAARSRRTGIEETARAERYAFFEKLPGKVATAHTLSDRAETLIMNITRGCGIGGLCSIPPVRGKYIRPLIDCTRSEIEQYLGALGQDYITDSTNFSDDYTRNRIRHRVIPELCEINPAFLRCCARLIDTAEKTQEHLRCCARTLENADATEIARQDDAVIAEYIRLNCEKFGAVPDSAHITDAVAAIRKGSKTQLCGRIFLEVSKGSVCFYDKPPEPFCRGFALTTVETPYFVYNFRKISQNEFKSGIKINNLLFNFCFDCDKISENIKLRQRAAGDKLRLFGRGCTKAVRRLHSEAGIPVCERMKLAVLADGDEIIWAQRLGVSEKYAVRESTENIVCITVSNKGDDPH